MQQTEFETLMTELLECTLPVISGEESDSDRYATGGTCFLVEYRDNLFAITARHVIEDNRHSPIEDIHILSHQGADTYLPLSFLARPRCQNTEISDCSDIAIIKVDLARLQPAEKRKLKPLKLEEFNPNNQFHPGSFLRLRGYPDHLTKVDYRSETVRFEGFHTEAQYDMASFLTPHCHNLKFTCLTDVDNISGMSGSPIFHCIEFPENTYLPDFCGMLIRGEREFETGTFIDSSVIYESLETV